MPLQQEEPTGGWTWTYLLISFMLFTVAFAIVRHIYNRAWNQIPVKNWKQDFKRRMNKRKVNLPEAKENLVNDDKPQEPSVIKKGVDFIMNRKQKNNEKPKTSSSEGNYKVLDT